MANPSRAKVLSLPALDRTIGFEPKPIAGAALSDSANSTFSSWQPVDSPRSTFTQPTDGARSANVASPSTDARSAIARSQPTDSSRAANAPSQTTEPGSPPPPTELLNLLRTANATRVQKRLIDTGYLSPPANGIWGPRSREALRDFRLANGLGADDTWDEKTQSELFAAPATRAGTATQPEKPRQNEAAATATRADPGRNPLKKSDAIWIQTKLRELGYFSGDATGLWGSASRNALRDFKSMNELPGDDHWDKDTEQKLASKQGVPASSTFIGGWSDDAGQCQSGDERKAPLVISARRAKTNRAQCDFQSVERETASRWRIGAVCSVDGNSWSAKISLNVDGSHLNWSSERGSSNYVRCAMK